MCNEKEEKDGESIDGVEDGELDEASRFRGCAARVKAKRGRFRREVGELRDKVG